MKLRYIFPAIAAVMLLTGCGGRKTVSTADVTIEVGTATTVTSVVTSSSAPKTTTAVTTTTAAKPEPPKDLVMKCRDSVEVYDEIKLKDFITERNVDLKDGEVMLNTPPPK